MTGAFRYGMLEIPQVDYERIATAMPEDIGSIAQSRPEFVKLEMWEMEEMEPAVMRDRTVLTSAGEPGDARAWAVAKDLYGSSDREAFGERTQDFCDSRGGRLEAVEGRIAPRGEGGSARLAAKGWDGLTLAMCPVDNQGVTPASVMRK
ncbi:MAG TPA: hypothetical protein VLA19_23965 [Herpetosiphonaceae bacterium]|nr:hypothetical protein [Herpetosiphonaceae bacterium]